MRWWPPRNQTPEPPRLPAGLVPLQSGEQLLQPAQRQAARAALQQIALGDDPAPTTLWDATLIAFAGFCQSLTRPCPDPNDSTTLLDLGLMNALSRLSAPATTGTGYGLLTWALLEVLEQEIGRQQVLLFDRQGQPLDPWTPLNGPMLTVPRAVYYRAWPCDSAPLPGLDLALAAVVLPPTGLARLLGRPDCGRVWLAQHALAQMPVSPPSTAATAATDSFSAALLDALRTWLLEPDQLGSGPDSAGWRCGNDLYLVGKQLAEALRQQPALAAYQRQIERNPALYRRLVAEGIAVSSGDKPVWKVTVSGADWTQTVAAVRIPLVRLWLGTGTIPPLPVFAGQILPQEPP